MGLGFIAYVVYWFFSAPSRKVNQEIKKEIYEVLNNDEFKAKGKYD